MTNKDIQRIRTNEEYGGVLKSPKYENREFPINFNKVNRVL